MSDPAVSVRRRRPVAIAVVLAFVLACAAAPAQFNPAAGQWGKTSPDDVRIMTWNVKDAICSSNAKVAGQNNWSGVARIIAAFRPDVLVLQECGDNNGNGTGNNVDSVSALTTTIGYLLHGGNDSFTAGSPPITAYVQLYAPGYDLPYVFVSTVSDGFNRNVILSRWPFADQNGDGVATRNDIPNITADLYAPGGNGGIRGFQTAEIDLPDATYAGDLVVGNCHLKAGTGSSDHTQRTDAARNIAYFLDYFWNGAGGSIPDPHNKIADSPPATSVLGPNASIVAAGDWNEDEALNGATIGPADWITRAQVFDSALGTDGPDRNRTDMSYDTAVDPFTGSNQSFSSGSSRFDYIAWQDSLVTATTQFKFNSASVTPSSAYPPEVVGWATNLATLSTTASDHRPVICDLALPAPLPCNDAGADRGFASLSSGGLFPRFSVCGSTASGGSATALLSSAPLSQSAFLAISATSGYTVYSTATIIPANPTILGPFPTDASGSLSISFAGGGGPLTIIGQWAVTDPGVALGFAISNAEAVTLLP